MLVERIGQPAETPWSLAFDPEVLIILRSTLRQRCPKRVVHSCWDAGSLRGGCSSTSGPAAMRRHPGTCVAGISRGMHGWHPASVPLQSVRLDPREQLLAQSWARQRGFDVIGTAHSHPQGDATPSRRDRDWLRVPSLMVIQGLTCGCGPGGRTRDGSVHGPGERHWTEASPSRSV